MKDQNRIELLRDLYRAGQRLRRAAKAWRADDPGLPSKSHNDMLDAIVVVEEATEAVGKTGLFEPGNGPARVTPR